MFIEKICMAGFKNYKEDTIFDFSNFTEIYGRNAQGKSSIAEAITWGLYGCDLFGDIKADSRLKNNESDSMYVIIDFIYNGQNNRIVRKKSKSLTLKLNDNRVTEKDLLSFLPDKDLFLAIFNPKYFLSYSISKQRTLLLKMLPPVRYEDIAEKYGFNDDNVRKIIESYQDLNDAVKYYDTAIKNNKKSILEEETKISVYENLICEASKKISEVEPFTDNDEKLLNELQIKLNSNNLSVNLVSTDNLKMELFKVESDLKVEQNKSYEYAENPFSQYINDLHSSLKEINLKKDMLSSEHKEMQESDSICPKCKQAISDEYKQHELDSLQEEINGLDSQINAIVSSIDILQVQIDNDKKLFIENKNKKINELTSQIKIYKDSISEIEEANKLMKQAYDSSNNRDEVISNIDILKQKQSKYVNYKAQVENRNLILEKHKNSLAECKKNIQTLKEKLSILDIEQSKLKQYNSFYIQFIGEILTSWLNRVSIELFSIVKSTGEIKDTFDVTFDNKSLKLVSNSEYTRAALELSNMFNSSLNLNIPIFVDDAESIIDIPVLDTQMIVAKVKDCELEIINKDEVDIAPQSISESQRDLFFDNSIYTGTYSKQISF